MFFTYTQNNSGGLFVDNDRVCEIVIIEADNYIEANNKAEDVGIYFNGCADGTDCDCCGDRWYSQWSNSDGTLKPELYRTSIYDVDSSFFRTKCYIYYSDGTQGTVNFI